MMRFAALCFLLAAALLARPSPAGAHAELDRAVPAVGSTVSAAPREVVLTFTDQLESLFTRVEVTDSAGKRVDNGDGKPDPADRSRMRVTLKPLAPGTYRVNWYALSSDTHRTEGDFTFTVKP
jgi:copper resistance protein C